MNKVYNYANEIITKLSADEKNLYAECLRKSEAEANKNELARALGYLYDARSLAKINDDQNVMKLISEYADDILMLGVYSD